jgi:hypothetical protein
MTDKITEETKSTKSQVSFPVGPDVDYGDYSVRDLRRMVTQAVMSDGMD